MEDEQRNPRKLIWSGRNAYELNTRILACEVKPFKDRSVAKLTAIDGIAHATSLIPKPTNALVQSPARRRHNQ
jgi:hypothetical protein